MRDPQHVAAFLKHVGFPLRDNANNTSEIRRFKLFISPKDAGDRYGRPGLYAFSNLCFLVNGMPCFTLNSERVSDYMLHKMITEVRTFCPSFMPGFMHVTQDLSVDLEQCLDDYVNKVY